MKSSIRKSVSKIIKRISNDDKKTKSNNIMQQLIHDSWFIDAESIGLFVSMKKKSEVDTRNIIQHILKLGKRCYLPRIDNSNSGHMMLLQIKNYNDFETNKYGILEPPIGTNNIIDAIDSHDLDILVVPGLAFDMNMNRLGRGGGFYDRYIQKLEDCNMKTKIIGICFEEQILDCVPMDIHDKQIDKLIWS